MKRTAFFLSLLLLAHSTGCSNPVTPNLMTKYIEAAKKVLSEKRPDLLPEMRLLTMTKAKIEIYELGGGFADVEVRWSGAAGRILVYGTGAHGEFIDPKVAIEPSKKQP